ncbi:hypothetical protein KGF56_004361 [Candida oxycetoniae]|uniref:Uncharacterized protein n=1 Tax=Candida oxycetoniae TaxID=497107 RepID=A0AAI9STS4_9ASCO|nr:uncharacterized protein KGF56_004361 [Candida oxycetoniae]KAI3402900.1 hypothetical protein KGF56_004361 [Candida oxycetoniae]
MRVVISDPIKAYVYNNKKIESNELIIVNVKNEDEIINDFIDNEIFHCISYYIVVKDDIRLYFSIDKSFIIINEKDIFKIKYGVQTHKCDVYNCKEEHSDEDYKYSAYHEINRRTCKCRNDYYFYFINGEYEFYFRTISKFQKYGSFDKPIRFKFTYDIKKMLGIE